jgi:hypothetical protein
MRSVPLSLSHVLLGSYLNPEDVYNVQPGLRTIVVSRKVKPCTSAKHMGCSKVFCVSFTLNQVSNDFWLLKV